MALLDDMKSQEKPSYGKRADGTEKGSGYFGEIKRPDGNISTELSVGINIGGKEVEIPTLVPTLNRGEIDYLVGGGKPTKEILDKAVRFSFDRIKQGKSPFANDGEQIPLPQEKK